MTFKTSAGSGLGYQAFTAGAVDVVAKNPIGTIVKAFDDTLGEAEFIYLPGVANLVAGDFVVYDLLPGGASVTRATYAAQKNLGQQVAVALQAVPAGSYGWFQISGVAAVNVIAATAAGPAFLSATAGQLSSTAQAGGHVLCSRLSSAIGTPSAAQAYLTLNRSFVQGQIT